MIERVRSAVPRRDRHRCSPAAPHVAAAAAGIGWVVLNRLADYVHELRRNYKVPVFAVSADNEEVGRIQGKQLDRFLPQGGSVLYIQGPSDSLVGKTRTDGLMKTNPSAVGNASLKCVRLPLRVPSWFLVPSVFFTPVRMT